MNAHFMDSEKEPLRQTETCLSFRSGARASVGCLLVQAAFLLPHPVRVTRAFPLSFMAPGMATPVYMVFPCLALNLHPEEMASKCTSLTAENRCQHTEGCLGETWGGGWAGAGRAFGALGVSSL